MVKKKLLLTNEVESLIRIITTEYPGYDPYFTFITVTKRISEKLYKDNRNGDPRQRQQTGALDFVSNPPGGTIADSVLTSPNYYDFYLIAQDVTQGSANPTHYHVIYDNSNIPVDTIHQLTFNLCFLYYNWYGAIKVPAPCQYAHKIAFLAANSLKQDPAESLRERLYFL